METLLVAGLIGAAAYYLLQTIREHAARVRSAEAERKLRACRAGAAYGYTGPFYR